MANEAVLVVEKSLPVSKTVADTPSIEKGTLVKSVDLRTVSGSTTADAACAGITSSEKVGGDGNSQVGVYHDGTFKVTLSGSCTVGDALALDTSLNHVKIANLDAASGSNIIGYALETGTNGETILMDLKPGKV